MDAIPRAGTADSSRTTWRGITVAVLVGLILGSLISTVVLWMRPASTGIADLDLVELHDDRSAGRSWVVELEATRSGYPFLIHLDDAGHPSLFYPDGPVTEIYPGERRRLPDATGQRAWRSPGGQLFVALSATPHPPLELVFDRAERAALRETDPGAALRAAREVLSDQLGPGVVLDLPEAR